MIFERNNRLDYIRGISILMVLFYHLSMSYINFSDLNQVILLDKRIELPEFGLKMIAYLFGKGYYGVFLFFILSGYLIHSNKSRNKDISWLNFYKNRFWRIYPLYFILLVFWFLYYSRFEWVNKTDLLLHTFLIHNFNAESIFNINDSFWSLAIEAQFYMLYPFIYFFFKKNNAISLFFVTLFLSVVISLFSLDKVFLFLTTFKFLFFWVSGCLLFEYRNQIKYIYSYYSKAIYFILIFFFIICFTEAGNYFGLFIKLPLINEFLFCILFFIIFNLSSFNFKYLIFDKIKLILKFFGAISYSLYLVHNPILISLKKYFFNVFENPYLNIFYEIFCVVMILILISFSLYQLIEKRFINYGKKIKTP